MKITAVVAVLLVTLAGCTTIQPVFGPVIYDATRMEIVGLASAKIDRMSFFGIGPMGETSLANAAVDKAAKSVGADTLVNIVADDEKTYVLPFVYTHTLTVKGLAIKYKK